jgi:hypothetical protein
MSLKEITRCAYADEAGLECGEATGLIDSPPACRIAPETSASNALSRILQLFYYGVTAK